MIDLRKIFNDAFAAEYLPCAAMRLDDQSCVTVKGRTVTYSGAADRQAIDRATRAGFAALREAYVHKPSDGYEPQVEIFLSTMAGDGS